MEIITIKDVCQIRLFFILRRQLNYTQMKHLTSHSYASSFFSSSTDGTFSFASCANVVSASSCLPRPTTIPRSHVRELLLEPRQRPLESCIAWGRSITSC